MGNCVDSAEAQQELISKQVEMAELEVLKLSGVPEDQYKRKTVQFPYG